MFHRNTPLAGLPLSSNKKAEWHALPQGQGLQTLCKLPIPGNGHLQAHVIIHAPTDAQLMALMEAAESMKLVKPKDVRYHGLGDTAEPTARSIDEDYVVGRSTRSYARCRS